MFIMRNDFDYFLVWDKSNLYALKNITDMNSDIPLVRKLIDLQGVTICLDKQNSSGRIETYLVSTDNFINYYLKKKNSSIC